MSGFMTSEAPSLSSSRGATAAIGTDVSGSALTFLETIETTLG